MSDFAKPNQPKLNIPNPEQIQDTLNSMRDRAQEALNQQPQEVQDKIEQSKTFYERNRTAILSGVAVVVVLKVNKRMVRKVMTEVLRTELTDLNVNVDLPIIDANEVAQGLLEGIRGLR